jgi:ADP-ribosylglycohydrolase
MLLRAGTNTQPGGDLGRLDEWVTVLNHSDEKCGALIRVDAFGYACPGNPALAAELAWRDAGWTHRRTGVYGAMFIAAAIAVALVVDDALSVFELALQYVPQRSRFHEVVTDSLADVRQAAGWLDAYRRINAKYGAHGHCQIYQEVGTLINAVHFAQDVGHGICLQVSQGNDTDSFGATAGSLLGALMGPGYLADRWLKPFEDRLHLALAGYHERSLSELARRMGELPRLAAVGKLTESLPSE